ncbi:MAG: glycerophosphodiester phosphodiesterase [Fimbriimonas sp.]
MLATLLCSLALQSQGQVAAPIVPPFQQFVVMAHRGDHTAAPENTLKAFRNAIKVGCDYVEIDLRTTSDGKLVIMHDRTVDRMTDGKGDVRKLTFAEIRKLKVMEKRHPEFGTERVPTFQEVLKLCRGKINIYLDFKDADVRQTYEELKKAKMLRSFIVYCGGDEIRQWHEVDPTVPVIYDQPDDVKTAEAMNAWLDTKPGISILDGPYTTHNKDMSSAAQARGVLVWPDIENPGENPKQWADALSRGVTGLLTDHPGRLIEYLKEIGKRK